MIFSLNFNLLISLTQPMNYMRKFLGKFTYIHINYGENIWKYEVNVSKYNGFSMAYCIQLNRIISKNDYQ